MFSLEDKNTFDLILAEMFAAYKNLNAPGKTESWMLEKITVSKSVIGMFKTRMPRPK